MAYALVARTGSTTDIGDSTFEPGSRILVEDGATVVNNGQVLAPGEWVVTECGWEPSGKG